MHTSAYDLKGFYNSRAGKIVRQVVREAVIRAWPDVRGLRVMGCGYAVPYLDLFLPEAERVFALMPGGQGAHVWPSEGANRVCLTDETELPIETNSIDGVLLIHSLEYAQRPAAHLEEIWRVLKSSGRLLAILPNRAGLWSMGGGSPFGHGAPFSRTQICAALREALFGIENAGHALYVPPFSPLLFPRAAKAFERAGPWLYPAFAGLHVIEATKQLYGAMPLRERVPARVRERAVLIPRPAPPGSGT